MDNNCNTCPKFVDNCNRCKEMDVKKEELGGYFYYVCGHVTCGKQLKKDWDFCPFCGQKIKWSL